MMDFDTLMIGPLPLHVARMMGMKEPRGWRPGVPPAGAPPA